MRTWIRGKDINPDTTTRLMRLLTALLLAAAIIIPGSATLRASENRHNGYYVATDGDDASKGTLRRPFRTIARALAEAHAGDTVFVRGGTYREQVVFPASGRADARIVLKAYGDERPVISGEGITVEGRTDMLLIRGRSHITVEGLEITALGTAEAGREANGIVVEAGSTDITLRGNHIGSLGENSANYLLTDVPEINEYLETGRYSTDKEVRQEAYTNLAQYIVDHSVICPLFIRMNTIICNKDLKGVVPDDLARYHVFDYSW